MPDVTVFMTFLVTHAALHGYLVAEHLADRLAQGLDVVNAGANFEFERVIGRISGPRRRNRS
jgi:hypothetical protein